MALKKMKVIVPYGFYKVGDIIEPTGLFRDQLRSYGYAVEIDDEPKPKPEPVEQPKEEPDTEESTTPDPEVPQEPIVTAAAPEPRTATRKYRKRRT